MSELRDKSRVESRLVAAPMMGRTDAAGCAYLRAVLPSALLFSEMIAAAAIVYGGARARARLREYFELLALVDTPARSETRFVPVDSALVLQLGGGEPETLYRAVEMARAYPFCEFNLNLGCPSPRVCQQGLKHRGFGASLVRDPVRAASCVAAMRSASAGVQVSVKTRIGVDELDSYEHFISFIERLHSAGCEIFYIHARKAWLNGISARANRELPPLRSDFVERLQRDMPRLRIVYNGGIADSRAASSAITRFGGVMIGRALWRAPYGFRSVVADESSASRRAIAARVFALAERNLNWSLSRAGIDASGGGGESSPNYLHSCSQDSSHDHSHDSSHYYRRALGTSVRLLVRAMSLYHGAACASEWRKFLLSRISRLREGGLRADISESLDTADFSSRFC